MKQLFQNIEMKNVIWFLQEINIYGKISKKFQLDQIFPRNVRLQEIFQQIWSFPQAVPKFKKITTRLFSVKPVFFYKPFPYN